MGIKYVLAKLEDVTSISEGPAEQKGDEKFAELQVTWDYGTEQGDDCSFEFVEAMRGELVWLTSAQVKESKRLDPFDAVTKKAWDTLSRKYEKEAEVTTYHSSSSDGSFVVRRVSFFLNGKWIEPKTHFVVMPRQGGRIFGVYGSATKALGVAQVRMRANAEFEAANKDRANDIKPGSP
ncbi:hypothetical protein D7Y57_18315 [Stenotrophomonas maltophilia]|uniref:Uncharacterized protein n=1 Tax=Stenotrophomonas maltophilia TaxID=40324 RepID=A0AAI9CBI9_STEMA|nr:hypothetical protein [Stenotrophomonas maltophilia]EKT4442973.1 hypothetical protein [Stenotrophomonas maltophilia]MBA0458068.1 hypothetical protein [Stenotrophomonas maltophilia]HDS1821074.1 hypothetical protein [Stenotrophomonas maltophilia]HDX0925062.1 hypothetical protein [Stenotrophomonas maltophilia]HEF1860279.1 hypothetical protein [Stenotrophomonas maltophilia]